MTQDTLLLRQADIADVLIMKDVVEISDKTFVGFGEGTTICPTKVGLDLGEKAAYPSYAGFMNAMPAYVGWMDILNLSDSNRFRILVEFRPSCPAKPGS